MNDPMEQAAPPSPEGALAEERAARMAMEERLTAAEATLYALAGQMPSLAAWLEAVRVVLVEKLGVPAGSIEAAAGRFLQHLRSGPGTRPTPPGFRIVRPGSCDSGECWRGGMVAEGGDEPPDAGGNEPPDASGKDPPATGEPKGGSDA